MSSLISENKSTNPYQDPTRFIDSVQNNRHIVFCFENPIFGKKIQFRFIRNGLIKGESCIYTTTDENIEQIKFEMTNYSIDVDYYLKRKMLKIFKIPNMTKYPKDIIKYAEDIMLKMFSGMNHPFRVVSKMIDKLYTNDYLRDSILLEKYYHSNFDKFNGILMCPYNIKFNPINNNNKWIETILENHHSAIFVTDKIEEGIAFDMD